MMPATSNPDMVKMKTEGKWGCLGPLMPSW